MTIGNEIEASTILSAATQQTQLVFQTMLNDTLTASIPEIGYALGNPKGKYTADPGQLPQILYNGTFASPIGEAGSISPDDYSITRATLAAPVINQLWNDSGVVIAKFDSTGLPPDQNPCGGDNNNNVFPATHKYCDTDGNAYVLQAPAGDPADLYLGNVTANGTFRAYGIDALPMYSLTLEDVVLSANKTQYSDPPGFLKVRSDASEYTSELQMQLSSAAGVARSSVILFNTPICDMTEQSIYNTKNFNATKKCEGHLSNRYLDTSDGTVSFHTLPVS